MIPLPGTRLLVWFLLVGDDAGQQHGGGAAMTVSRFEPHKLRNIMPLEWETIGKLAAEAPDLTKVEARLLAALQPGAGPGGRVLLRPASWRELMEAGRLGVITPQGRAAVRGHPAARTRDVGTAGTVVVAENRWR